MDFNLERAGDVLMHKHLLDSVKTSDKKAVFHVRPVHVSFVWVSFYGG